MSWICFVKEYYFHREPLSTVILLNPKKKINVGSNQIIVRSPTMVFDQVKPNELLCVFH